ncbi:MAG: molybdate ABC transporter permease subunit [Pseudomonadota bacterium]
MSQDAVFAIILLSVQVALVATLVSLPFALLAAKALARPNLFGRSILSALVHLPLVLPPVVTGYVLLITFGRSGPVGSALAALGMDISFSWVGAALAAGIMAFPLFVRPIRLAFEAQDPKLDELAQTLGASRLKRLLTLTLPLAWPGILAGAVLAFAKALGEFGATITFVSNIPGETQTLSLAIYSFLQTPSGESVALTLIAISIALSFAAILVSEIVLGRIERKRRG